MIHRPLASKPQYEATDIEDANDKALVCLSLAIQIPWWTAGVACIFLTTQGYHDPVRGAIFAGMAAAGFTGFLVKAALSAIKASK